jgi:tetratricopeptide (TPR) repeat protein
VRKAGNKLRITAQLINVTDGYHLWSESYDRELEDVFAIQDEISRAIVGALRLELALEEGEALAPPLTENMEAYDFYLRGKHYWYKRYKVGLQTALEYFQKAIEKDPGYAPPYAGISLTFTILGALGLIPPEQARRMAEPAAERALALDDELAEAHFSMAGLRMYLHWDWDGAEREYKRAIELNPKHAEAGVWAGFLSTIRGRIEEGVERAARARARDPDSFWVALAASQVALYARQYDEVIGMTEWVLDQEPEWTNALFLAGAAYSAVSRHNEAIAVLEKAVALTNRAPAFLGAFGRAYAAAGMDREAQAVFDELRERSEREYVLPLSIAFVCASMGRAEDALRYLEAAVEEKSPPLTLVIRDRVFDDVRSDERFIAILKRMGLDA